MYNLFLGVDTSNYTTSLSAVDQKGRIIFDGRIPLRVNKGHRGLRQQEAVFQHLANIPKLYDQLMEELKDKKNKIKSICVSTRPRSVEGSYMPCFMAGYQSARLIGRSLDIPIYETSHQEGHIKAIDSELGIEISHFYVFHLSGGTCELLKVEKVKGGYFTSVVGGSLDISFGQLIDRIGVAMGLEFPAGNNIDKWAMEYSYQKKPMDEVFQLKPIKIQSGYFNLSGIETKLLRILEKLQVDEYKNIAFAVMENIYICINNIIDNLNKPLLLVGGVSESKYLREKLKDKENIYFGSNGKDNAVGVAIIGGEKWQLSQLA